MGTPFFEVACTKIPNVTFIDEKKILIKKTPYDHVKSRSYVAKNNNEYLDILLDIKKNVFKSYVLNKNKRKNWKKYKGQGK